MPRRPNTEDVFLNVPFDRRYNRLFLALVCSLICIGRNPRCAREVQETSRARMTRITELIRNSAYAISDLSRMTGGVRKEPRLNMAFEAGIIYAVNHLRPKVYQWFLLESEQHRLTRTLSDLNGHGPEIHGNRPERIIQIVINWFRPLSINYRLPTPRLVLGLYNVLLSRLPRLTKDECGYPAFEVLIPAVVEIAELRNVAPTRIHNDT